MRAIATVLLLMALGACSGGLGDATTAAPSPARGGSEVADQNHSMEGLEPSPEWAIATEDVLPEATAVVENYLALTDQIGESGGVGAGAMQQLVTEEWLPTELRGFEGYQEQGIRTLGATRYDSLQVQSSRLDSKGSLETAVFLCVDSTRVMVIDQDSPDPPTSLMEWLLDERVVSTDEALEDAEWQSYFDAVSARFGFREPIIVWLRGPDSSHLRVDSTENWLGAHPCGGDQ